jgi:hypothetical protein
MAKIAPAWPGYGENMKSLGIGLLVILSVCAPLSGELQYGTVCVAPVSPEPPQRFSPGGYYNPATLTVRIDKGQPIVGPHKSSIKITSLDLAQRHLAVLMSD